MNFESELKAAVEAVHKASKLCIRVQSSLVSEETVRKKDDSPVTVADFGAQAVICHELMKAFPDIPIVAEEDSSELRAEGGKALSARVLEYASEVFPGMDEASLIASIDSGDYGGGESGRFWTLDPIDGTKGFLRGEQYAVALALIEDGQVVIGVLGCPNLPLDLKNPESQTGCILTAVRGGGSSMRPLEHNTPKHIAVSDIDDPKHAPFCESVESSHSSHGDSARIAELLGVKEANEVWVPLGVTVAVLVELKLGLDTKVAEGVAVGIGLLPAVLVAVADTLAVIVGVRVGLAIAAGLGSMVGVM